MISEIVIKFKKPIPTEEGALAAAQTALGDAATGTPFAEEIEDVRVGYFVDPGAFAPPTLKHPDAI